MWANFSYMPTCMSFLSLSLSTSSTALVSASQKTSKKAPSLSGTYQCPNPNVCRFTIGLISPNDQPLYTSVLYHYTSIYTTIGTTNARTHDQAHSLFSIGHEHTCSTNLKSFTRFEFLPDLTDCTDNWRFSAKFQISAVRFSLCVANQPWFKL